MLVSAARDALARSPVISSMDDLSPEECRFLLQIGDEGVVAFNPREDEVIAFRMDASLVAAERVDEQTALLRLTSDGHTVARACATTWADAHVRLGLRAISLIWALCPRNTNRSARRSAWK
jgi:hypothetical protein